MKIILIIIKEIVMYLMIKKKMKITMELKMLKMIKILKIILKVILIKMIIFKIKI
jgi:hypothetical protein